jgi:hypothetical protein
VDRTWKATTTEVVFVPVDVCSGSVVMMVLAGAPCVMVAEPGEAETEKSFVTAGSTLRVKACCADRAALAAVMVTVEDDFEVAVPERVAGPERLAVPLPLSVKVTPRTGGGVQRAVPPK